MSTGRSRERPAGKVMQVLSAQHLNQSIRRRNRKDARPTMSSPGAETAVAGGSYHRRRWKVEGGRCRIPTENCLLRIVELLHAGSAPLHPFASSRPTQHHSPDEVPSLIIRWTIMRPRFPTSLRHISRRIAMLQHLHL